MDYRSFWIYGIEDTVKITHLFRFTLLMWLLETFPWHLWLVPSPQGSSGLQTGLLSSGKHPRPGPSLQEEARRRGSPPGGGSPGALPPHLWGTVAPPHLPALGTTQLRENQGPAPPRLGGPKARSPGPLHPAAVGAPAAAPVGRAPR